MAALIAFVTAFVDGSPAAAAALPLEDDWDDGWRCIGILLWGLFLFLRDPILLLLLEEPFREDEEEEEYTARELVLFFCLDMIHIKI